MVGVGARSAQQTRSGEDESAQVGINTHKFILFENGWYHRALITKAGL
jgi:hypothetical protein